MFVLISLHSVSRAVFVFDPAVLTYVDAEFLPEVLRFVLRSLACGYAKCMPFIGLLREESLRIVRIVGFVSTGTCFLAKIHFGCSFS